MSVIQPPKQEDFESFCRCWKQTVASKELLLCDCGEGEGEDEWNWEPPSVELPTSVIVDGSTRQVLFHPYYSTGTAAVRGDTAMFHDYHYYWEVKLISEAYGTDIMVGIGSDKMRVDEFIYNFNSLLGFNCESYGFSYHGHVVHNGEIARDLKPWGRGSIVGVRLDMFMGTLEYFLNREPQGISFYNLKRHDLLYPMVCSTAAHSCLKLIYTGSWKASLFTDAAKLLAKAARTADIPPGLAKKLAFWMTTPIGQPVNNGNDVPRPLPLHDNVGTYIFERTM